ncbi:hypothetical protein IIB79_01710 [candidate division KSB1 bacterium]|nr:hypothetical protein [candidate division KSB1 bacterium]
MYTSFPESFKDDQLQQIGEYRAHLQKFFKRKITIAEAIIHWFALADAEDTLNSHYSE